MSYKKEDYIRENGDIMCPECKSHAIPYNIALEKKENIIYWECSKCLGRFKITIKITNWEMIKIEEI